MPRLYRKKSTSQINSLWTLIDYTEGAINIKSLFNCMIYGQSRMFN